MSERALRKHARRKIEVLASFNISGKEVECKVLELSEGGLFAIIDNPLSVGSKVSMKLLLAGVALYADGEVVYIVSKGEAAKELREPGMGIMFVNLKPEVKSKLTSLIF